MIHVPRRAMWLGSALAAVALLGTSITPSAQVRAASHAARAGHAPSGTLTISVGYEPSFLDPQIDYDTGGNTYITSVYEGLATTVGATKAVIKPDLATSWTISPNGKVYTFHLRPGVKFHDGSPVNAAAVKFSIDRFLKAKQGAYANFVAMAGADVVNPLTVRIRLKYPFASLLPALAEIDGPKIVSPKTVGNHKISATGASYLNDHDAGSGPYMLQSYQRHQRIILTYFPGYWGGWSGKHFARIVMVWPTSTSTMRLQLQQGGLDGGINLSPQDFDALKNSSSVSVREYKAQTIHDIRINTTKPGLNNVLVRRALNYAFDYNGVIKGVYQGHAAKMQGVGPFGLKNFIKAGHPYTYNLAKARQLLSQAGAAGKNLSFTLAYLPEQTTDLQTAQIFQSDLAKIGIKATLQGMPIATYSQVIKKPSTDPDIWFGQWTMDYGDDAQMYWSYYCSCNVPPVGGNVMYYKDPTTDALLTKALHQPTLGKAYKYWQKAMFRVYQAAPNIWPVQANERIALRKDVKGYTYNFVYSEYYWPVYTMYRG